MSADNKLSVGKKIISVLLGALLVGFMWRARGSHGSGSMWGIIYVSTVITLFIYSIYGNREKMKYELIPVGTIMAALLTPAWGVVNQLMGGVIGNEDKTGAFLEAGSSFSTVINGWHGLPLLLMTGFSLISLYGIFIGTLFSKRDYKIWHYLIYVLVFFVVSITVKLTVAPAILNYIAPEITDNFANGINLAGKEGTVREIFIKYAFNESGIKKINFGRAYFESISHISEVCGALAVIIAALIAFRDKFTALVSFVINIFCMIGITVSDIFNINRYTSETIDVYIFKNGAYQLAQYTGSGSILKDIKLPAFLQYNSWSMWEFFTGFFIGFGILLIIALLPNSITAGRKYRNEPVIRHKVTRFIYHVIGLTIISLFAEPVRCLGMRVADCLEGFGIIDESKNDMVSYIIMGVVGLLLLIFVTEKIADNILFKNLPVPFALKPHEFANKYLPIYVFTALLLFMIPDKNLVPDIKSINCVQSFKDILWSEMPNIISVVSVIIFIIVFSITFNQKKKQSSLNR